MENNDLLKDDFLREMIGKSSQETPSGDFVEKVMNRIQHEPEIVQATGGSFFSLLKSSAGYLVLAGVLVGFFLTSDIPFMNWIPGKQYFFDTFLPYFNSIFAGLKSLSGSGRALSIPIMIIAASGLFFVLDRLLSNRSAARNHPAV
jgi:hypothetical protein